jgi:hypothetical protein
MADEPDASGISWRELAAREEGQLHLPGSSLVDEVGNDEGQGWGFDRLQKGAMYQSHWTVDAEADEVGGVVSAAVDGARLGSPLQP